MPPLPSAVTTMGAQKSSTMTLQTLKGILKENWYWPWADLQMSRAEKENFVLTNPFFISFLHIMPLASFFSYATLHLKFISHTSLLRTMMLIALVIVRILSLARLVHWSYLFRVLLVILMQLENLSFALLTLNWQSCFKDVHLKEKLL